MQTPERAPGPTTRSWRLRGRIKVHPAGYGFVVPDDHSDDVKVAARDRGAAMDGDTVDIETWVGPRGFEGRVTGIVERGRAKITGQMEGTGRGQRFVVDDPRITGPVVLKGGPGAALPGQAVVAEIIGYPDSAGGVLEARIVKVLGDPNDPRTEVEKVLAMADVTDDFPPAVVAEAALVADHVRPSDRADRVDLTHLPFVTIDPETARDFDDAMAVEPWGDGGSRLWVAVADVSHYVRPGRPLDVEALRRGCSIYLPSRAIPMLPEPLSAHMCSLVPEADRLALVVRIDLDRSARVTGADFMAAVIHSKARLDYPGVAAALAGDTRGRRKKYEPHLPMLRALTDLGQRLRARRFARGSLELDLPESVIELDDDDPTLVRDVRKSRRDPGERQAYSTVEEMMLAANEAVARSFTAHGEETLWRVHDVPSVDRMAAFAELASHYGLDVDVEATRTPLGMKKILDGLRGQPAERPLTFQLLRSLKQATYDVVNVGHFGLAATDYVHFTSPIRRYPDLVVHRLLKQRLAREGKPSGGFGGAGVARAPFPVKAGRGAVGVDGKPVRDSGLAAIASTTSYAERQAAGIEREVKDLYRAYFMRDRVGDVFDATVTGVTSFGVFVTVEEPFVEGLVRIEALSDDWYELEEGGMRLVGRRTGKSFALGDPLRVEVENVSVMRRRIEFVPADRRERAAADRRPERGAAEGRGGRRPDHAGRGPGDSPRGRRHKGSRDERAGAGHGGPRPEGRGAPSPEGRGTRRQGLTTSATDRAGRLGISVRGSSRSAGGRGGPRGRGGRR